MFRALLLLPALLAAMTYADDMATPTPCCTDRQFQARLGRIGGNAYPLTGNTVFIDGYQDMAYDYYAKKIGAIWHQRQPDGTMRNVTYLMDYKKDRQYIYEDGKCTITKIGQPMNDPCIPANATFIGYGQLGYGTESLVIKSWEWTKGDLNNKISVTGTGCVPVVMASYGIVDRVAMDVVELINGFKPGLDDPTVLATPTDTSMCTFVDSTDTPTSSPDSSSAIVGKRSTFLLG